MRAPGTRGFMAEAVRSRISVSRVTVADTKISFIDGDQGILIYRGYRIENWPRSHPTWRQRICFWKEIFPGNSIWRPSPGSVGQEETSKGSWII